MNDKDNFVGFYPETFKFLKGLSNNNSKSWFDKHRSEYENYIITPSKYFVNSLKGFLNYINPELVVEPKFNKSFVRINKDMRFAKKPYKEYFLIRFGKFKWDCELFFVINIDSVSIGVFINNEKKSDSRFNINFNSNPDLFFKICKEYNISKKYSVTDLKDMSEVSSKFNPEKDVAKLLNIRWFTIDKTYNNTSKIIFSHKLIQETILVYNSLYPLYLYGTSLDIERDILAYKKRLGIMKIT